MTLSAFPYVGGKTRLADWIIGQLPAHTVYAEPFGGSAAVLLNKPRSDIEVFNDLDGDIVQFFEVARTRPDELKQWVRRTPYSEELHTEWVADFYAGERPDDPVVRAGRFLFLRYTQYAAKYEGASGFRCDSPRSRSTTSGVWAGVPDRIDEVCRRLQGVTIQHRHFSEVIEQHDDDDTVFYADPPYVGKQGRYRVDDFSHAELADSLAGVDGHAIVSYTDPPEGLYDGWSELTQAHYHKAGGRKNEPKEQVTERILLNFDPAEVPAFSGPEQAVLGEGLL